MLRMRMEKGMDVDEEYKHLRYCTERGMFMSEKD